MKLTFKGLILFARDVSLLKDFYIINFGFELLEEISSEWVLLRSGTIELGIHKMGIGIDRSNPKQDNNVKLVFDINGDIREIKSQLLGKKVIMRDVKTWNDSPYFYCDGQDPEGNVFQLRALK